MNVEVSNDGIAWFTWHSEYCGHLLYSYPFVREVKIEVVKIIKENDKFTYNE